MIQLELVVSSRCLSICGREEWLLRYGQPRAPHAAAVVQTIYIRHLHPAELQAVRVVDEATTAFSLEALYDTGSRPCSAGDMLAALYGVDPTRGLRIPAVDFGGAVRCATVHIELRVRSDDAGRMDGIAVLADARPAPC